MDLGNKKGRSRRGSGKPTLADVAKAANVSAITVSRALRNPSSVSPTLRERVERAVRDIGYIPDSAAQALASARTNVIGVIIPSVTNAVFIDVLHGIYDTVEGSRFQIQLGNSNYSTLQEEALIRLFIGQRPAALIVTGLGQSREAIRLLGEINCPIVQIMELGPNPVDMLVGFSTPPPARRRPATSSSGPIAASASWRRRWIRARGCASKATPGRCARPGCSTSG